MIIIYSHISLMRVKVAELKTHLSKYLRQIDKDGQPIKVCVREDAVAYLTSARTHDPAGQAKEQLAQQLQAVGIQVSQWGSRAPTALGPPGNCHNPAGGPNSVESIRRERSW